ncbi:hypothetical protein GCM10010833_04510 [Blastomonas aquatica]|uniref:Prolyl 4-hydroxylase alpha subunit Fe(2+) 2OG dioxygenase domain-containing protein n=2 Tax=Blastomonas aquatica TaxID=1510276 RepID=A0ABQ1IYL4_9SPHN|nr:hypothetical protein GCM10010833_04510 [Blastomonas aquatica]
MLPSLLIVDDFLADPHAARAAALALAYDPASRKGNYPGTLSAAPLAVTGLEEAVSRIIGVPLAPQPGTSHRHCRLTLKGDRGVSGVHIDPCFYSGILYLSRNEDARGGTDFFRHKRTGLEKVPTDPLGLAQSGYDDINALVEDVVNRDTLLPARWERVMRVPMRFNRLILFSPWLFHNSADGFGASAETGRLVHLQFFARA